MSDRLDELAVIYGLIDQHNADRHELVCAIPSPDIFNDPACKLIASVMHEGVVACLDKAGECHVVADIFDAGCGPFDSIITAKKLAKEWRQRQAQQELLGISDTIADGRDPVSALREVAEKLARQNTEGSRIDHAKQEIDNLLEYDIPVPPSVLGNRLLEEGGFGVLYGKPGMRKSWLALQLLHSVRHGTEWLGIPTSPVPCAFISLELGSFDLQDRLRKICYGSNGSGLPTFLVARPSLVGAIDLLDLTHALDLESFIRSNHLKLLVIDPLSRAHSADENDAQDFSKVLGTIDSIRHATGCAILLVHHERKSQGDKDIDDMDALRGSSRLQSDPTLLMRLLEYHGVLSLRFPKVNLGMAPDEIFLRKTAEGPLVTCPKPKDSATRADENRAMLLAFLDSKGDQGASIQQIKASVRLIAPDGQTCSERAYRRYLDSLRSENKVVSTGKTNLALWIRVRTQQELSEEPSEV